MHKTRLTITVEKEILRHVDEYVDGSRIRNRSHAIEYILAKYFAPKVRRALILAGGKGLKMRPFTFDMPKTMIPLNGRPVLEHIIENFRRYDVREIYISLGHQGEKIKKHFGDGSKFGVRIKYLTQGKAENGTAAPVLQAKEAMGSNPFFVYYGDVLTHVDLDDMADFHLTHGGIATIGLASVNKSSNWGVVRMKGTRVYSFLEKPDARRDLSNIINAGVYIFEPKIFEYLSEKTVRLEKEVFPKLVEKRQMHGYLSEGEWYDVGNPDSYQQAVKEWR